MYYYYLHHHVTLSSQDNIYKTSVFPFSPFAESLYMDSTILTLLICQQGQYANNLQLAKYIDQPSQSEWGLTLLWLYPIQGRLHPRPPLTP